MNINQRITDRLFEMQDKEYREFHSRLIPTVDREKIIGVRVPLLRRLSNEIAKDPEAEIFLNSLPHKYYDENCLHGFIIEKIKDYDRAVYEIDRFLPFVDNWATCDFISPAAFKAHPPRLLSKIKEWMASDRTYTVRFGIEMLMKYYLDSEFKPEYNSLVASVKTDEYYVKMMAAWYFATALSKQYDVTVELIQSRVLDEFTHKKTIQKACESFRITKERKEYLKTLR